MAEQALPDLNEALNRMWKQFLPQIEERVAVLEAAGMNLAKGGLADHERDGAQSAAHKLAGVLGTFGLTRGTVLAREAELICSGDADPDSAGQLIDIAGQLRVLINSRT